MSEDNEWRQLGPIVNAVLRQTKAQAIRKGSISWNRECSPNSVNAGFSVFVRRGTAKPCLSVDFFAAPAAVQLELPFGIAPVDNELSSAADNIRLL